MKSTSGSEVYNPGAPWIILIAGGHYAGKKSFSKEIQARLNEASSKSRLPLNIEIMHMSDFEEVLPEHAICKKPGEVYAEHKTNKKPYKPSRFDFEKVKERLKNFTPASEGLKPVKYQSWNIIPPTVILLEGLYALYDPEIRDMASMRIFMDLDGDVRLGRWILQEAGEDKEIFTSILNEYVNYCRPEMDLFIQRTQEYADIILPGGNEPSSVKLIATGIYDRVQADFLKHIKVAYPGHEIEGSPVLRSLHREEVPVFMDLDEDLPDQQYYDVN